MKHPRGSIARVLGDAPYDGRIWRPKGGYDAPTAANFHSERGTAAEPAAGAAGAEPPLAKVYSYPGTGARDAPSSELVEFLEIAERRIKAIEQAADAAVSHVSLELNRLLERLTAGADSDAERMRAIGDVVVGHARAVEDWSVSVRTWLESEFTAHRGRPSDGVILLARRMTIAGIPTARIEALLAGLGVADPQAAVRHALDGPIH